MVWNFSSKLLTSCTTTAIVGAMILNLFLSLPLFAADYDHSPLETDFSSVDELTITPQFPTNTIDQLGPHFSTPPLLPLPLPLDITTSNTTHLKANVTHEERQTKIEQCQKGQLDCAKLKIKLLDFLASGYNMPGENFEALVSEDLVLNGVTIFPKNAKIQGEIVESIAEDTKLNQKPSLSFRLQDLSLPNADLPEIFDGDYQQRVPLNIYWTAPKTYMGVFTREMASALKGGLKGAYKGASAGLSVGGMQTAFLTYGASVAGGGLVGALWHGAKAFSEAKHAIILPEGAQLSIPISSSQLSSAITEDQLPKLSLQTATENSPVKIKVQRASLGADPFAVQNQLTVNFDLQNQLSKELSSFHLVLMDNYGERYYLSPFAASAGYKTKFPAHLTSHAEMTFTIKSSNLNYYLVVFSPDKNQKILYKQPVIIN